MCKIGRPSKLNDEMQDKIINSLRMGNFLDTTAAFCGISKTTIFAWIRRGAKLDEGVYTQFASAVRKAQAEAEIRLLQNITNAAKTDWMASAWKLERKNAQRWSLFDCVQMKRK